MLEKVVTKTCEGYSKLIEIQLASYVANEGGISVTLTTIISILLGDATLCHAVRYQEVPNLAKNSKNFH